METEVSRIKMAKSFAERDDVFVTGQEDLIGENHWYQILFEAEGYMLCRNVLCDIMTEKERDSLVILRKDTMGYVGGTHFDKNINSWVISIQENGSREEAGYKDLGVATEALTLGVGKNQALSWHAKMNLFEKTKEFSDIFEGAQSIDERSDISGIAAEPV